MNKKPKVQLSCDFIEFIQKDFRAWFLKLVFLSITSLEISCSSLLEFPVLPKKDSAKPGCYNDLLRVDLYLNYLNKIPRGTQRSQMGNAEGDKCLAYLLCWTELSHLKALLRFGNLLSPWLSPADWVCLLLPCLAGTFSDVSVFPESQAAKREAQKETGISSPSCFGLLLKLCLCPAKGLLNDCPFRGVPCVLYRPKASSVL